MSYRKFGKNDVLINTLKANPESEFVIYDSNIFYNDRVAQVGQFQSASANPGNIYMTPSGHINLYEYNIDRLSGSNNLILPYLSKDSTRVSLHMTSSAFSVEDLATEFAFGDRINGVYPQNTSIRRQFITTPSGSCDARSKATCGHNMYYWSLRPLLNHYGTLSEHYKVTSSFGNKDEQKINLIHIPSIFYGNRIKPGTVSLRWHVTGTLLAEITDSKQNGELIQNTAGASTGSNVSAVQGVVMYDEGFIILTGSENLFKNSKFGLEADEADQFPKWIYWGAGARDGVTTTNTSATYKNASFAMSFEAETTTETITMYARAHRGQVNYSNNPTFISSSQQLIQFTSSHVYEENQERLLKNIVSSSHIGYNEKFRRQVYISKVAVYDEEKNLIGIATLADPILKDEDQDYVFKLKMDL